MEVVDAAVGPVTIPDERDGGGERGVADAIGYVKIIMSHVIEGGTAGEAGEIPSAQHADRVCRSGRGMRCANGNTGRNNIGLLPSGELFVGIENVQHASAI